MTPVQIPFEIPLREAFEAEDYLVTSCNAQAVDWIDRWPDWNAGPCAVLYGPAGCGKTHLTHVWQKKSGARRINLATLDLATVPARADCYIIEDVDDIAALADQQERLFHLYNRQKHYGGHILLTAKQHPKRWRLTLPDLRSRMLAAMAFEIGLPDDELLAAVIVKQFMDRQITVPEEVVNYLLLRIERSFAAAQEIVGRADSLALSHKRKITVPLVRDLFD